MNEYNAIESAVETLTGAFWVFALVNWSFFTLVNMLLAGEKKRSVGGAFVGSLIAPVFCYLYFLAVPKKESHE
jgi:hypothetical protein